MQKFLFWALLFLSFKVQASVDFNNCSKYGTLEERNRCLLELSSKFDLDIKTNKAKGYFVGSLSLTHGMISNDDRNIFTTAQDFASTITPQIKYITRGNNSYSLEVPIGRRVGTGYDDAGYSYVGRPSLTALFQISDGPFSAGINLKPAMYTGLNANWYTGGARVWGVGPVATYKTNIKNFGLFITEAIQYNSEYAYQNENYQECTASGCYYTLRELTQRPIVSRTSILLTKNDWGLKYFSNHSLTQGKIFDYSDMSVRRTWSYNHTGFELNWNPALNEKSNIKMALGKSIAYHPEDATAENMDDQSKASDLYLNLTFDYHF